MPFSAAVVAQLEVVVLLSVVDALFVAAFISKDMLPHTCMCSGRPSPPAADGALPFFILGTAIHLKPARKRTRASSAVWPHSIAAPQVPTWTWNCLPAVAIKAGNKIPGPLCCCCSLGHSKLPPSSLAAAPRSSVRCGARNAARSNTGTARLDPLTASAVLSFQVSY